MRSGLPLLISLLLIADAAQAQFGRGGGEWVTAGGDAQRSGWIRTDGKISKGALEHGGFELLWKTKLPTDASGLTDAVLLDRYIGYRGFRSLAFVGGANGNISAVDTDLNRIEWTKRIPVAAPGCGSPSVTLVTRPASTDFPSEGAAFGGLGGRGGPAKSGVGKPYEGALTLTEVRSAGFEPRALQRIMRFMRVPSELYALTPDGVLHAMYVSNGEEPKPAIPFLPPGANARGLTLIQKIDTEGERPSVENTAYAVTAEGCGAQNAVWALDLGNGKAASWTAEAPIAGDAGIAMGPDGTVYVAAGSSIIALEPKTLKVKASSSTSDAFITSPVLLQYRGKVMVAAASKNGKLHLLDVASLNAPVAVGGSDIVGDHAPLTVWQDHAGTNWVAVPSRSALVAMKIVDNGGSPAIETGWTSPHVGAVSVIGDVVFVAPPEGSPAVIYALDAATGHPIWNSSNAITSRVNGAVSGGGGQIYVTDRSGVLYAFGFPMEH